MRKANWILVVLLASAWTAAFDAGRFFAGNRALTSERLQSHLAEKGLEVEQSGQWSPQDLERATRIVRQLYQDNGYPLAKVTSQETSLGHRFVIDEGPLASLGWTQFEGNQAFSPRELSSYFRLGKKLDFDDLEAGLEEIRRAYRNAGYPQATVERTGLAIVESEAFSYFPIPFRRVSRNLIRLHVKVDEGPLFRFGGFHRPPLLQRPDLDPPTEGDVYSEARLIDYLNSIRRRFFEEGRLIRDLQVSQRIHESLGRIDFRVDFELYPQMDVLYIDFEGDKRYPDSFYRRELTLAEGDLFDPRQINRSLQGINSTGVLKRPLTEDDVEIVINARQEVEVKIHLEERKPRNILYSLSRADLGGLQARVIYTMANLLGLSEELGLEVEHGGGTTGAVASLASRYLLGTDLPLTLGLRFFRRHSRLRLSGVDEGAENFFRSRQTGVTGLAAYRIRHDHQVGTSFTARRFTRPAETANLVLEPFWDRTFGDDDLTRRLRLSNRFSIFGQSTQAWNWRPELEFRQTAQESAGAPKFTLRLKASYARFSPGEQLLSERLFNDADDLRGFSATTSGPWGSADDGLQPLGGDAFLAVNTEYEVPLNSLFAVAPFVDSGVNMSVASPQGIELVHPTNRIWRTSLGTELRLNLPQPLPNVRVVAAWNPLRLDTLLATPAGLSRLYDPRTTLRLAFDPVF